MDKQLKSKGISLLKELISTPSFSREEQETATIIENFLVNEGVKIQKLKNNVWAYNQHYDHSLPTILLNSHHDTVKPSQDYSINPFDPILKNDKLFGLGSNDAGGALVSLLVSFLNFYKKKNLNYNLLFAATAEEEISGKNGIKCLLPHFEGISTGIIGEPTQMEMAIAEKGLMVLDGINIGTGGHAARDEGINALYSANEDITWIKDYAFPKVSPLLGSVKMSVNQISAGKQHNVTPDICKFVIDIRINELYSNKEVYRFINKNCNSKIVARSLHLNSSSISKEHPIVQKGINIGLKPYGSPTLSDQALMNFPTLKIGPGNSARSHIKNEYIFLEEIERGIDIYIKLLENILIKKPN